MSYTAMRQYYKGRRVLDADGRLYSPDAPYHGERTIYNYYCCRCLRCGRANSTDQAARRNRERQLAATAA